jgi:hypothetical protein
MKWLLALILSTAFAQAETSKLIPAFLEAVEVYDSSSEEHLYLRPEVRAILDVLHQKNISPDLIKPFQFVKTNGELPEDDKYDSWIKNSPKRSNQLPVPDISLQASKIDVIKASQFSDDIYAYFFITDGVIPTGKVTSIYKGISSGQGFFFNPIDRAIFPLIGITAKAPTNHLIVDYGIIESDGDDIKKLQALSAIIIDLAIGVYATQNPQAGQVLMNLRKEIKALADLLLSFNHDDRLVTDSFGYTSDEVAEMLSERSYVDIKKNHKKEGNYGSWEYDLSFRMVR